MDDQRQAFLDSLQDSRDLRSRYSCLLYTSDPHAGAGDVVRSHLLIHFQDDIWFKEIVPADHTGTFSSVVFRFQHNKRLTFKACQRNGRTGFFQKFFAQDIFYRKLIGAQRIIDRECSRNSKDQVLFLKFTAAVDGGIQNTCLLYTSKNIRSTYHDIREFKW